LKQNPHRQYLAIKLHQCADMKPSRFILSALLFAAIFCCWLIISSQPSHDHVVSAPALPHGLAMVPHDTTTGVLINPNFQTVLQALKQRATVKELPEPEVTTIQQGAINRSYYNQTFTLPITNR
jgi:hypothetical protein